MSEKVCLGFKKGGRCFCFPLYDVFGVTGMKEVKKGSVKGCLGFKKGGRYVCFPLYNVLE